MSLEQNAGTDDTNTGNMEVLDVEEILIAMMQGFMSTVSEVEKENVLNIIKTMSKSLKDDEIDDVIDQKFHMMFTDPAPPNVNIEVNDNTDNFAHDDI